MWKTVTNARTRPLSELGQEQCESVLHALFDLVAAADEACKNVGIPDPYSRDDDFLTKAKEILHGCLEEEKPATLCQKITSSSVCVLPKRHLPQVGMTFRSLTHYISLCPIGEAWPVWVTGPWQVKGNEIKLLLIPRPENVEESQFQIIPDERCGRSVFPAKYRYFDYRVGTNTRWLRTVFPKILRKAGSFDGVVFPEMSLASDDELFTAFAIINKINPLAFVVAGVAKRQRKVGASLNSAKYIMPINEQFASLVEQHKHHRWHLNRSQMEQYDLTRRLDTGMRLWENIDIRDRRLNFIPVRQSLTFCFVICEDLARQEPVTRLVRAVAPDLVIALLMDGPQLVARWPARYATVLSEDPGCSVLTLTNAGLARRSRRIGANRPGNSRAVALWSDRTQAPVEIKLRKGAGAIVLTLEERNDTEYSADGRSAQTAYLVLNKHRRGSIRQIIAK
jgi:hypothetical protein